MTSLRIRRCAAVVKMHPDDRDRGKRQEEKNRNVVVGRSVMMMRLDFESTARETLEAPGKNRAKYAIYELLRYHATQRNATQRNATQRNATQRNATQRNATQRIASARNSFDPSSISNEFGVIGSPLLPSTRRWSKKRRH
ncbi:hypothetical protein RP20_CCG028214 [Aedes albopictus]|nr:hypothetical protein RP20_CCG028214 [Aedes albopictus]